MLDVPSVVRARAEALGPRGGAWLRSLPELVAGLAARWWLDLGEPLAGGHASFVVRCRRGDEPVVLKVPVPEPGRGDEAGTLGRAAGRGYVRLLAHDSTSGALLLEELGPALSRSGRPLQEQLGLLRRLLEEAWGVPPAPGAAAQDKASRLARLVRSLSARRERPAPGVVVEQALAFAERRAAAFDPRRCVALHGDAAPVNALALPRPRPGGVDGYVLVDPEGFLGDPAYDLGVAMRDGCEDLLTSDDPVRLARGWCAELASGGAAAEDQIWEWAYLERVSTGLFVGSFGAYDVGDPFLASAELLL